MLTDVKDNMDLYEEREKEILEELGRTSFEDPKYEKLQKELDTIAKHRISYIGLEQDRLNNNRKNDNEEQKLLLEEEKVKNDRRRNRLMFSLNAASLLGGSYLYMKSYHMEEKNWAYNKVLRWAEELTSKLRFK